MAKGPGIPTNQILQAPDFVQGVVLAAGTAQAFDTPTGMGYALFSFDQDFWVKYGSTAATVPSSSTTSGTTNSELNPTIRNIASTASCTGISLISNFTANGSISWYKPA